MSRGRAPVSLRGCVPMRSAGDVYSSVVSDQLVAKINQPTKGLTRVGDLREGELYSAPLCVFVVCIGITILLLQFLKM